jgi:hypothetical protein
MEFVTTDIKFLRVWDRCWLYIRFLSLGSITSCNCSTLCFSVGMFVVEYILKNYNSILVDIRFCHKLLVSAMYLFI